MPARKTSQKPDDDALGAYRAQRDLRRSGEPSGGQHRRGGRPTFVVQKHGARSLHYDFRLEADGVLKSWSVPKGPSTDPAEKRLAVPTEDHPIDYENFEGVIPPGEYGAGPVIVWDTGTYANRTEDSSGRVVPVSQAIRNGHLSFDLHGKKLRGGYSLTRIRGGRQPGWLLVKKADEFADRGSDPEHDLPKSVKTGKDIDQVAEQQ
jgi:DNA ligase D-like protein (predicted 3'-phosphoesterase)